MILRLFRPCFISSWLYPDALFRIKSPEKVLVLTFDDGPDPGSTPEMLNILDKFGVKAIFFCNGRAAEKNPLLVERIKSKGHLIGNHGFDHADGWKTNTEKYCEEVTHASGFTSGKLFRPPYGRIGFAQYKKLRKSYRIVFWDLMAYDFDRKFGAGRSLKILTGKIRKGSVIIMHDTPSSTCSLFLGDFLEKSISQGYRFILPELI